MDIIDQNVIATSGQKHHPIVVFTGNGGDSVGGTSRVYVQA
jgi:hypothetical protein